MSFTTYSDAIEHLVGYVGGNPEDQILRDSRRAILDAYRELANAHRWTYLYHHGRIVTTAPYDGGGAATVTYLHSGGTNDRQVTIASGTWPTWAASGYLRVGAVIYRVASRVSGTILTLDAEVNPGADIVTPTPFQLYQDTYLLPADYIAQDQALYEWNFGGLAFTHPRDWLFESRYRYAQGTPRAYTITGDSQYPGRLVMRVFPFPDTARTIDFLYQRRPRDLRVAASSAGLASAASTVASLSGSFVPGPDGPGPSLPVPANTGVVTLAGGSFTPAMVGAVVRLAATPRPPTSEVGKNPPAWESVISAYIDPAHVVLADPVPAPINGAGYVVSDPIDIEPGAMLNAFWRCCEKHMSMIRVLKDKPSARAQYLEALEQAKSADSRSFAGRSAGPQLALRRRLRDMPTGPDEP